jgi:precorrin-2 dehydrogenase/sirohydrochlorin ferrochelatase
MTFPIAVRVAGMHCVVVGGGRIATRKVQALLKSDAVVRVVAPACSDELVALAHDGVIELLTRPFEPADLDGAQLVISATDRRDVAQVVAAAALERRILMNAAEAPELSTFASMPSLARGDITIAVSTNGKSPAFASWLLDEIGAMVGPEYAQVCALAADLRAEAQRAGTATESLDWRKAFAGGVLDLVRNGDLEGAREVLRGCQ